MLHTRSLRMFGGSFSLESNDVTPYDGIAPRALPPTDPSTPPSAWSLPACALRQRHEEKERLQWHLTWMSLSFFWKKPGRTASQSSRQQKNVCSACCRGRDAPRT